MGANGVTVWSQCAYKIKNAYTTGSSCPKLYSCQRGHTPNRNLCVVTTALLSNCCVLKEPRGVPTAVLHARVNPGASVGPSAALVICLGSVSVFARCKGKPYHPFVFWLAVCASRYPHARVFEATAEHRAQSRAAGVHHGVWATACAEGFRSKGWPTALLTGNDWPVADAGPGTDTLPGQPLLKRQKGTDVRDDAFAGPGLGRSRCDTPTSNQDAAPMVAWPSFLCTGAVAPTTASAHAAGVARLDRGQPPSFACVDTRNTTGTDTDAHAHACACADACAEVYTNADKDTKTILGTPRGVVALPVGPPTRKSGGVCSNESSAPPKSPQPLSKPRPKAKGRPRTRTCMWAPPRTGLFGVDTGLPGFRLPPPTLVRIDVAAPKSTLAPAPASAPAFVMAVSPMWTFLQPDTSSVQARVLTPAPPCVARVASSDCCHKRVFGSKRGRPEATSYLQPHTAASDLKGLATTPQPSRMPHGAAWDLL